MAQTSATTFRRAAAQLRHWLYLSPRQIALIVAVEILLTFLGLPLWAHAIGAGAMHWIVAGWRR
jgi:hypothetical protein